MTEQFNQQDIIVELLCIVDLAEIECWRFAKTVILPILH